MLDINEFLKYYINFFPVNDIDNTNQHEIRPLSIYEFSNCDLTCLFTYREVGIPLPKLIQDFNNQTGIPGLTWLLNFFLQLFELFFATLNFILQLYKKQNKEPKFLN